MPNTPTPSSLALAREIHNGNEVSGWRFMPEEDWVLKVATLIDRHCAEKDAILKECMVAGLRAGEAIVALAEAYNRNDNAGIAKHGMEANTAVRDICAALAKTNKEKTHA